MDLNQYRKATDETAQYPQGKWAEYLTYSLIGEVGEIAQARAKLEAWGNQDKFIASIFDEIGDAFWFATRLAVQIGAGNLEAAIPHYYYAFGYVSEYLLAAIALDICREVLGCERLKAQRLVVQMLALLVKYAAQNDLEYTEILDANIAKLRARAANGEIQERRDG